MSGSSGIGFSYPERSEGPLLSVFIIHPELSEAKQPYDVLRC